MFYFCKTLHSLLVCTSNDLYNSYHLVWATKLLLAAIGLVFPALVLGYKSFNCSMYHVPVPTLIEIFVWIYFEQLFTVAGSIIFWHKKLKESPKYLVPIPMYFSKFVQLSFKQLVCIAGSIIFGIQTRVNPKSIS